MNSEKIYKLINIIGSTLIGIAIILFLFLQGSLIIDTLVSSGSFENLGIAFALVFNLYFSIFAGLMLIPFLIILFIKKLDKIKMYAIFEGILILLIIVVFILVFLLK